MATKPSIGINFDEISDDLETSFALMDELGINNGELRTVHGVNFVHWSEAKAAEFSKQVANRGIRVVAAATPLFKWYPNPNDVEIPHDSFGFDPRLGYEDKVATIEATVALAASLAIPRLRIFSELGPAFPESGAAFANSDLLAHALEEAAEHDIDLYIENEPVCTVHNRRSLLDLFEQNEHPNLKLWLDVANLEQVGESVTADLIDQLGPRLGYVHVKDFTVTNGELRYCPLGDGVIDYEAILGLIVDRCPNDLVITVETHAREDKVMASRRSLQHLQHLVQSLNQQDGDVN